nr:MAG TPA: Replication initiation and membrane attachment [Caudoviricetes sp.]
MAENKRYYWLKLKEDFFEEDAVEWLEEQGKEYCLFYLKLCLKSIRTDGILIRNVGKLLIPYDAKKLAEVTRTDIDTVIVAMELLKKIGLVEVMDDGALYMSQLETMVGSESGSAARMRKMRAKNKDMSLCDKKVTAEKDIEKDTDIEREKENTKESSLLPDPGEMFDFEEAFNKTFEIYPKKKSYSKAKKAWLDKLLGVVDENRADIARLIYGATAAYLHDYKSKNPDDTEFRYLPQYTDWLINDCDYWLGVVEKRIKK